MRSSKLAAISAFSLAAMVSSCELLPPNLVQDPTKNLSTIATPQEIVKSLRCELSSFFVENTLRRAIRAQYQATFDKLHLEDADLDNPIVFALKQYNYLDLDNNQYSAIQLDIKDSNSISFSMGYDWKKPSAFPKGQTPTINQLLRNGSSRDYHFGPSLAGGATFEFIENIALRQDADLGPAKPALQQKFFTTAFIEQPAADKDFYCYDPLLEVFPAPTNIQEAANDILSVLRHGHPEMKKFHRIFVGGSDLTLAAWLMAKTEEIASNSTVVYPSTETIPIGQLKYAFSLEVKPAIDLKYTLVARLINPLVPELSATADDTSNFTLWLNGTASLSALGAQQGNTCIVTGRLAPTLGCRNKKQ